nr:hypothetical protein [Tanacetum cinerariifolium]
AALDNFMPGANADGPKPAMRDYTPRRYDAASGELDIDFVLHGDGPAATWAAQAAVGQHLYIAGPRGSMIVRRVLLDEFKLDEATVKAAGYWRLADTDEA